MIDNRAAGFYNIHSILMERKTGVPEKIQERRNLP